MTGPHDGPATHISMALAKLRTGVAISAGIVAVCALIQLVIFGFAHFTEVRWSQGEPEYVKRELTVVGAGASSAPARATEVIKKDKVESAASDRMRTVSDFAVTGGVAAACSLAAFTMLGVCIAGGSAVPGVEKTVSAATWAVGLAFVSLPWVDVFPSVPFRGVLSNYDSILRASDAANAGLGTMTELLAMHAVLPMAAVSIALVVGLHFRAGVERGVIVRSVSQLDTLVDREISTIRSRGVSSNIGARTVGVMDQAVGAEPEPMLNRAAGAESLSIPDLPASLRVPPASGQKPGRKPTPGSPLKRPI